jgi:putative addiction module component (TIGR02574 family)
VKRTNGRAAAFIGALHAPYEGWYNSRRCCGGGMASHFRARVFQTSENMIEASKSVFDLSPSEKLQLVEDLWDDLAATPEIVPIHDWQISELERRKANLMKNPASGLSWEEVKRRIRSRHGR